MEELERSPFGGQEFSETPNLENLLSSYESIREHEEFLSTLSLRDTALYLVASYRHLRDLDANAPSNIRSAAQDLRDRTFYLLSHRINRELQKDGNHVLGQLLANVNEFDQNCNSTE